MREPITTYYLGFVKGTGGPGIVWMRIDGNQLVIRWVVDRDYRVEHVALLSDIDRHYNPGEAGYLEARKLREGYRRAVEGGRGRTQGCGGLMGVPT